MATNSSSSDLIAALSPERVVAAIALVAVVTLLLAAIAGVARAQVQKGNDFQYAQPAAPTQPASLYSSRGGTSVADLGPVAALEH